MKKYLDTFIALLVFLSYILYRIGYLAEYKNEMYFLATCLSSFYFILRASENSKGLNSLILTAVSSFFGGMAVVYIWQWLVLGRTDIWIYYTLIAAVVIFALILIIKYMVYVHFRNRTTYPN